MANPITSDRILAGIKRRVTVPASQSLLDDADVLDMVNDVVKEDIIPIIVSLRQNYFVQIVDEATVSGQNDYNIPSRAAGRTVRDLKLKYGDTDDQYRDLTQIAIEDIYDFSAAGTPTGYYFKGDKVSLIGDVSSGSASEIRFFIERYPSDLVETQYTSIVSSVAGTVVTVDSVPSNIVAGVAVDFIYKNPAHEIMLESSVVTATTATTITFADATTDIPTSLGSGDYIALEEDTPVLQLPKEVWPYLELRASQRVCEAIGDFDGSQMLEMKRKDSEKNLMILLSPRNRGEATKIVNRNGLLRGSRYYNRLGGGYV